MRVASWINTATCVRRHLDYHSDPVVANPSIRQNRRPRLPIAGARPRLPIAGARPPLSRPPALHTAAGCYRPQLRAVSPPLPPRSTDAGRPPRIQSVSGLPHRPVRRHPQPRRHRPSNHARAPPPDASPQLRLQPPPSEIRNLPKSWPPNCSSLRIEGPRR